MFHYSCSPTIVNNLYLESPLSPTTCTMLLSAFSKWVCRRHRSGASSKASPINPEFASNAVCARPPAKSVKVRLEVLSLVIFPFIKLANSDSLRGWCSWRIQYLFGRLISNCCYCSSSVALWHYWLGLDRIFSRWTDSVKFGCKQSFKWTIIVAESGPQCIDYYLLTCQAWELYYYLLLLYFYKIQKN